MQLGAICALLRVRVHQSLGARGAFHPIPFQVRAENILRQLCKLAQPMADELADSIHNRRQQSRPIADFPFGSLLDAAECTLLVQLYGVGYLHSPKDGVQKLQQLVKLATAPVLYGDGFAAHNGSAVLVALAAEIDRAKRYMPEVNALELTRLKQTVETTISARSSADSSRATALAQAYAYFNKVLRTYGVPTADSDAVKVQVHGATLHSLKELSTMSDLAQKHFWRLKFEETVRLDAERRREEERKREEARRRTEENLQAEYRRWYAAEQERQERLRQERLRQESARSSSQSGPSAAGVTGAAGGRKSSLAPLMVGTHVCIDGLVTQLEYNGRVGCVQSFLDDRYSIKLSDGTKIALKRENLRPMSVAQAHAHVLGLEAPPERLSQLTKAYRAASLKWHPDKNLESPEEAKSRFIEVQRAYDELKLRCADDAQPAL